VNQTKPNQQYLDRLRKRYAKASKKERTAILDALRALLQANITANMRSGCYADTAGGDACRGDPIAASA
jgi:hypothetical protein